MRLNRITGLAVTLALMAGGALAATVTVQPPSYTVNPPAFKFTLPDTIGGPAGASVKSAAIVNGHLVLTLSTGATLDAGAMPTPAVPTVDLSGITSRLDGFDAAIKALQAQLAATPAPTTPVTSTPVSQWVTPTVDPCAKLNGAKWDKLTVDPTMSIASALNCANPNARLLIGAGFYAQVFHIPDGLNLDIGGVSAAATFLSGSGGCTVDDNNSGNCSTKLAYRKGVIHTSSPVTIHDLTVAYGGWKAQGNHDGQAGIYLDGGQSGVVTITNVFAYRNENGFFANQNSQLELVVNTSDFKENGTDGGSHSNYISGGPKVTYNNVHDYGSNQGNNMKSRVPTVVWNGGWSKSVQGRWIEAADGATMTVNGGDFVGNNCCQNMFGNGTESTSKGPGNTVWHGPSRIWLQRNTDFANAGSFTADSNVNVYLCGDGAGPFNDKGGALNGWTVQGCAVPIPADPPFISGAVNLPPPY